MKQKYSFAADELKLKKQWLIALLIPNLLGIIFLIAIYFLKQTSATFSLSVVSLFINLVGSYTLYYCAYKRPGTKWLTTVLVINAIITPPVVFQMFKESSLIEALITTFLIMAYAVWFYTTSIRLRRINKRVKKEFVKLQTID